MDSNSAKPILAITLGDICGIGPEIVLKALQNETVHAICKPLVVGDARMVYRAARALGLATPDVHTVQNVRTHRFSPDTIAVRDVPVALS